MDTAIDHVTDFAQIAAYGMVQNLARLINRKNFYLVPFAQDDWLKKPASLQSDYSLIGDTLECAMRGRQLQPVLTE